MNLQNVIAKLNYAVNMLEADGPKRTIIAELTDVIRIVIDEDVKLTPFPVTCSCHEMGTPRQHKRTSQGIAQQAYANYARYFGRNKSLEEIRKAGGFDCVEIRMLLAGLRPDEFAKDEKTGEKRRANFLAAHPDIRL